MIAGNGNLLHIDVPVDGDQLHSVEQRPGDSVERVGRGDKDHIGEVKVQLKVVIAERVVLRRIEHLQQCRRRIAGPARAEFVDLVQQDHRIHRVGLSQRLHNPAGLRAHVGPAVPADFCFVTYAA